MELTAAEGRVLACLIAEQAASPESHALSLDDVRFACNQGDRPDAVAFDDRTVEDALVALKSKGLARFVLAGRNVGPVRYRHRADERWRLGPPELAVLAVLLLGGPQTIDDVRTAVDRQRTRSPGPEGAGEGERHAEAVPEVDVEAALDALAGRTPTPFATRVVPPSWGGETLWAEVLTGQPSPDDLYQTYDRRPRVGERGARPAAGDASATQRLPLSDRQPTLAEVVDRLASIERRLAAIEAALAALTEQPGARRSGERHESSRVIR
ncbi:MAG: DUF480 domain-containing protein [Acidimicrobiales bacterium]